MIEKQIILENIDPIDIYGANNAKINQIKTYFPKLKIVPRGNIIKVFGPEEIILEFEKKMTRMVRHFAKYNSLTESQIERLILEDGDDVLVTDDSILVHAQGRKIKARTANQRKMVEQSKKKDLLFAVGPAGTGKTYTAVALAVHAYKNKLVRKIILTRPAVEAGENLGFLPGDMKEKLDPYMQPLYDALHDMFSGEMLEKMIQDRVIEIAPLAFMRGRTLDNAFVILDEAQNTTTQQMRMFLTRMGKQAKFIVTGDISQIDLPGRQKSGLKEAIQVLENEKDIGMVFLNEHDVVRHRLVKKIIKAYDKTDVEKKKNE
ncbi:MAG: PhoH family protein [Flavobacteriales bacterium]